MARDTQRGFTLIELLIAMTMSLVVLAGVVSVFVNQRKIYSVREHVAEMQQNARAGMYFMARELTMAGYDPTETSGAAIVTAAATTLQVSMDLNGDGDTADSDEHVTYALYDAEGDGDQDLGRDAGGGSQLVAENIVTLAFAYTLADETTTATPADLSQIRSIDVSLTARTATPDPQHATNSGYRTKTLTTTIQVRNLGF